MEELDLKELLIMLWRKKISVIIIIAISIVVGYIYTYNYTIPLYSSTATVILGKISTTEGQTLDTNTTISQSDLSLNSSLILTYSELATSRSIMEEVKQRLDSDISVEELMEAVSVERVNSSDLLDVSASTKDASLSQHIVTEVVDIFSEHIKEIYKIENVYIIDNPTVEKEPYNIHHERDITISAVIGVIIACAYVLLYTVIDNTVKASTNMEELLKTKTLITIPYDKKNKEELITLKDAKSVISESFKTLRTNVQFSSINSKGPQTLLITSCLPSDGKSYVSANLAISFAQTGKRVILVDSDMRRGRQNKIFNISNRNGLSNYISNIDYQGVEIDWNVGEYINKTNISNLDVITSGSVPPNPAELLGSSRLLELVENLKKYYDVIIFDGAPILPITDSLLLGRVLEKVMLVAVHNKTKRDNLVKAKESIEDVGGKVIGIALNKVPTSGGNYNNNYYYYSSEDEKLTLKEIIQNLFGNAVKKTKSKKRRLNEGKTPEQVKEDIKEKEEYVKQKEFERIRKEDDKRILAEEKERKAKIVAEEKAKKDAEKKKQNEIKKAEWDKKKAEFKEKARVKKEELSTKYNEYKIKKAEEKRIQAEERAKREAELAKIREEERIKKEEVKKILAEEKAKEDAAMAEERRIQAEEKAKREAELAKIREEERIKKEEEKKLQAEEKAKREAELAKIREEERIKKEEERKLQAEEKARKEAELAKIREEERIKKELEAKYTEEYLQENLYPKTKYNKF